MTPDELDGLAARLELAYNVGLLQPYLDAAAELRAAAESLRARKPAPSPTTASKK